MTKPAPILTLADGYPFDLDRLLAGRLLVTGVSGSGKSRLLRRLLEQAAPHVPIYVIDPEGEFHTLREKFDLLVCAPDGADAVATPETAPILARFLLETGVSAVLNIYDLKASARLEFVRAFCEALVNAPQAIWRSALVVMDEAHIFCPEGDRSECGQAVIDLATRGRKRGFGLCLATQRLAQLNKNAAGQMLNKFIGGTSLTNDVRRAAEELGEPIKGLGEKLRALSPGQFYAAGPALPPGVQLFKAGPVITTHPTPGKQFQEKPPEPGPKIRKLLADRLQDLPQQAIKEAVSLADIKAQLEESRETVRRLMSQQPKPSGVPEAEAKRRANEAFDEGVAAALGPARKLRQGLQDLLNLVVIDIENPNALLAHELGKPVKTDGNSVGKRAHSTHFGSLPVPGAPPRDKVVGFNPAAPADNPTVSKPQRVILDTLAQFDTYGVHDLDRTTLAVQAGVSPASSGFQNNLGMLRTAGLIDYRAAGMVGLTDAGRDAAHHPPRAKTLSEFHAQWFQMVPAPQAAILKTLVETPTVWGREALAGAVGASANSSGFQNNLGRLRSMGAIEYPATGQVKASALMFPQGVKR
jgi:energy-coupling factor transporter ATP-binding protein EcfA2